MIINKLPGKLQGPRARPMVPIFAETSLMKKKYFKPKSLVLIIYMQYFAIILSISGYTFIVAAIEFRSFPCSAIAPAILKMNIVPHNPLL